MSTINTKYIFDQSLLASPMFDDHHRDTAKRLCEWLDENGQDIVNTINADLAGAPGYLAKTLADAGWFTEGIKLDSDSSQFDFRTMCLCRQAFSYLHDLCDFAFAIQTLSLYPIIVFGDSDMASKAAHDLLAGKCVGAFALSEAHAGSDLSAIKTSANKHNDGYSISGEKTWIANASDAQYLNVLARTGGAGSMGLSLFLVSSQNDGVSTDASSQVIAPRSLGTVSLEDCNVPQDCVLGGEGMGFIAAMDTLEKFRMTVGAAALGFSRRAIEAAVSHTRDRKIGTESLSDKQLVKTQLADMSTMAANMFLITYQAAWEMDKGLNTASVRSSMAKFSATENAQVIVDRCLQLHGASGCVANSLPESLYRQVRSLRIYEGTSEIQQLIIGDSVTSGQV